MTGTLQTPSPSTASRYRRINPGTSTSSFLDSRGFGWLLEVDDDDLDQKPLL